MTLSWSDRIIEAAVLLLLVLTPLAFGAQQPWSEAIVGLIVLAMAVAYVIGNLRNWELRIDLPPGWLPASLFLLLILLQALVPLSIDPDATRRQALKLLAVAVFFVICWNTFRTRAQGTRAVWVMIGVGTVISVLGMAQRATWNGLLYWIGPEGRVSSFGPFINRTHYAGLMLSIVMAAVALFMFSNGAQVNRRRSGSRGWIARLRAWNSTEGGPARLVPVGIVVMGAGALVSGSRGGTLAFLAALSAVTLLTPAQRGSRHASVLRVALIAGLVLCTGVWIGGDVLHGTLERFAEELDNPESSPRLRIWADAIPLWLTSPLLGTGLATFGVAYPLFRTIGAPVTFSHAESDVFQLLTDTGAVGLSLLVLVAAALGRAFLRQLRGSPRGWAGAFALAALVALAGAVLQGLANFNLPVTSNLLYLTLVLALPQAQAGFKRS